MRNRVWIYLALCLMPEVSLGESICDDHGGLKTPLGVLQEQVCRIPNRPGSSVTQFLLEKKIVLSGSYPMMFRHANKANSLLVIEGSQDPSLACPARTFLIDLTGNKPRVFAFGVKNACAEYHWASWGKKRSVIAIKENIRFTYSNGKLMPPPPDFGDGIPLVRRYPEDQRNWPFVEELPIP